MPDIRPFKGVLYNPEKVDISKVVAEPYDVISPAQQKAYYNLHPCNIVRLILGEQCPSDNEKDNCYTRAAFFLDEWLSRGILQRDKKEGIYICEQVFLYNGRKRSRTGVIARLKLQAPEEKTILPHENTFSQPVRDRLKLTKAVRANLSPIFGLFPDDNGKINTLLNEWKRAHRPCFVFEKDKIIHKLWRLDNREKIAVIKRLLKDKQVFIADGHHRYQAALNYKYFMEKNQGYSSPAAAFNYVMAYLAGTSDKGLTILPTHRALKIRGKISADEILRSFKEYFAVQDFAGEEELFSYMRAKRAARIFGMYLPGGRYYALRMKRTDQYIDSNIKSPLTPLGQRGEMESNEKSSIAKSPLIPLLQRGRGDTGAKSPLYPPLEKGGRGDLDVVILHEFIIKDLIGAAPHEEDIFYTRDAREARQLVDAGKFQIGFFLCPTTLAQVRKIAQAGEKMPHKSTYFYPKALTGLVINLLYDE